MAVAVDLRRSEVFELGCSIQHCAAFPVAERAAPHAE